MRTLLLLALAGCGPAFTEEATEPGGPDAAADVVTQRGDPHPARIDGPADAMVIDTGDEDGQGVRRFPVDATAAADVDAGSPYAAADAHAEASGVPSGCSVVACAPRDPACCTGYGLAAYCGAYEGGWLCCAVGCP